MKRILTSLFLVLILIHWGKAQEKNLDQSNLKGFIYLGDNTYSCNGQTHTVKEYRHRQTGIKFVLIPSGFLFKNSESKGKSHKIKNRTFLDFSARSHSSCLEKNYGR